MKEEYKKDIQKITEIIYGSKHAVFFGGAGVSTDSGIPDFRGTGGLYNGETQGNEYFLSRECLENEPERFYEFYRKNMLFPDAKPNNTHKALAELEKMGIIKSVITQNIDGLHQASGSRRVIELHGTVSRLYCTRCGKAYGKSCFDGMEFVPLCESCGGIIRPDVILYGERLDGFAFADAENEINSADVLIAGGSSLTVNPAASLVGAFNGKHLIIVNYSPTPYDGKAEFVIRDSLADFFNALV
ncbi:MAG: NAD-dependent protein deacylase [Clostridia bacterium]|nr:NAD-dependent protein deacylase [Clostridia bacterium]